MPSDRLRVENMGNGVWVFALLWRGSASLGTHPSSLLDAMIVVAFRVRPSQTLTLFWPSEGPRSHFSAQFISFLERGSHIR